MTSPKYDVIVRIINRLHHQMKNQRTILPRLLRLLLSQFLICSVSILVSLGFWTRNLKIEKSVTGLRISRFLESLIAEFSGLRKTSLRISWFSNYDSSNFEVFESRVSEFRDENDHLKCKAYLIIHYCLCS